MRFLCQLLRWTYIPVHTFISNKSSFAISDLWDSGYLWLQIGNKPVLAFFLLVIYCFHAKQNSPEGCSVGLEFVGNLWDQDLNTLYVQIRQIRHTLCFEVSLWGRIDSCSSSSENILQHQRFSTTFMVYESTVIDKKQLEDIWNNKEFRDLDFLKFA